MGRMVCSTMIEATRGQAAFYPNLALAVLNKGRNRILLPAMVDLVHCSLSSTQNISHSNLSHCLVISGLFLYINY